MRVSKIKLVSMLIISLFIGASVISSIGAENTTTMKNLSGKVEFVIELDDIPETLVFSQEHVPDYFSEYVWQLFIDSDSDENTGNSYEKFKGTDLLISISHLKNPDEKPYEGTIEQECQFATFVYNADNGYYGYGHNIIEKTVDCEKDIMVFYCPRSWDEIEGVDKEDHMIVSARLYDTSGEYVEDLADGNGLITDPQGDTSFPLIDLLRCGISSPTTPEINGPSSAKAGEEITYTFSSSDIRDCDVYYYIDWGDGDSDQWIGPYASGEEIEVKHTWPDKGAYTLQVQSRNIAAIESDWATLEVSMPKVQTYNPMIQSILKLLEHFPFL